MIDQDRFGDIEGGGAEVAMQFHKISNFKVQVCPRAMRCDFVSKGVSLMLKSHSRKRSCCRREMDADGKGFLRAFSRWEGRR